MDQIIDWEDVVAEGTARLDRWLKDALPQYSSARIKEMITSGRVTVNGRGAKKGQMVKPGDEIRISGVAKGPVPLEDIDVKVEVAWDDERLLVVDKPRGMATQPLSPDETGTLASGVVALYPGLRGVGPLPLEPGLLQRLDKGTSGLVMFAKDDDAWQFMRREFEMRRMTKTYRAIVHGEVKAKSDDISVPLGHHPSQQGAMVAAVPGVKIRGKSQRALTRYSVIEQKDGFSLLEIELITGVTHQARVHLAHMGHPVVGDDRYGKENVPGPPAYALQAYQLIFTHPENMEMVDVRAQKPLDMTDLPQFTK